MEYQLEAKVILTLEHKKGSSKSKHLSTDFNLEVSDNMDRNAYFDEDELPNKGGSQLLTNVLVQGLLGNIHQCHEKGYRDSAEHLRYIISELERGFVEVANVEQSNF